MSCMCKQRGSVNVAELEVCTAEEKLVCCFRFFYSLKLDFENVCLCYLI